MVCYWFCLFICSSLFWVLARSVHPDAEDLDDPYQKFRRFLQCANSTQFGAELGYRYYEDYKVSILSKDGGDFSDCWWWIQPLQLSTIYADDGEPEPWVILKDYPDISVHPVNAIPFELQNRYDSNHGADFGSNFTLTVLKDVELYEGDDGLRSMRTNYDAATETGPPRIM